MVEFRFSETKASNMMIVMKRLFPINQTSYVSELLNTTRDSYGSFMIKTIFFFCLFEKLHEEWMIEINHWNHEPLLIFSLTNLDCKTPFWYTSELLLLPMQKKSFETSLTTSHLCNKTRNKNTRKEKRERQGL